MKNVILIMFTFLSLVVNSYPQQEMRFKPQSEVRLTKEEPSVYITFERVGKREPLEDGESNEGIWLRLHNNTRWAIIFPKFGIPKALDEVGMYYDIETIQKEESFSDTLENGEKEKQEKEVPEPPLGYKLFHASTTMKLLPGRSIVFSVPHEHLAKNLALRINFSYEWEDTTDVFVGREVKHYVYFYSSKLPQQIQDRK
jgi:hypothetical protein